MARRGRGKADIGRAAQARRDRLFRYAAQGQTNLMTVVGVGAAFTSNAISNRRTAAVIVSTGGRPDGMAHPVSRTRRLMQRTFHFTFDRKAGARITHIRTSARTTASP